MFYASIFIAIFIITLEVYSLRMNAILDDRSIRLSKWSKIYKCRFLIGLLFVPIAFIKYPILGTSSVGYGFPLVAAVIDESGAGFVGATTMPFLLINIIICYFMVHVVLFLIKKNKERLKSW